MTKTIVIAEAGVNHNGDLNLAKKLIEVAADAGADYVKFQTFSADELVTPFGDKAKYQLKNTEHNETQQEMLSRFQLNHKQHLILMQHAKSCGIKFLSSAFDLDSLYFLDSLGLDFIKIPSGEITNYPYLRLVSKLKKPTIISTGMSTLGDIEAALNVLVSGNFNIEDVTLLHCTTEYPVPPEEVNLRAMETLKNAFGTKVGYSDHTVGIEVSIAAVSLGASLIEKHFTLDRNMSGPDHLASLDPAALREMIGAIRIIEKALGNGRKVVMPSELNNSLVARKSIVAKKNIKIGDVFTEENLCTKRPGNGISPMRYEEVLGKIAKKDFLVNQLIEI